MARVEHIKFADAVHHAGQHGFIGIHASAGACQHIGECGDTGTALPQILQMVLEAGELVAVADLSIANEIEALRTML